MIKKYLIISQYLSILDHLMIILLCFSLSHLVLQLHEADISIISTDFGYITGYHCLSLSRFRPFLQTLRDPFRIGVFFTLKDDTALTAPLLDVRIEDFTRFCAPTLTQRALCRVLREAAQAEETTSRSWCKKCWLKNAEHLKHSECSFETFEKCCGSRLKFCLEFCVLCSLFGVGC